LNSLAGAALFEQRFGVVKHMVSHKRTVQRMFRASIGRNAMPLVHLSSLHHATAGVQTAL
jgi:hypothetical protein